MRAGDGVTSQLKYLSHAASSLRHCEVGCTHCGGTIMHRIVWNKNKAPSQTLSSKIALHIV
jgi:hypothetical protein